TKYQTKPLGCWNRAKELMAGYYKSISTAREDGKLLFSGGSSAFLVLPAGIGDYVFFGAEPYGAMVATNAEFSQKCAEVVEARGFARDVCSYMLNYWGSMIQDRYLFGGPFPKIDFCMSSQFCDTHSKWFQYVAEYLKVPYFSIDIPLSPSRYDRTERFVEYLVAQMQEGIEWLVKVTGREYNDELLIESVRNECEALCLMGEIVTFQKVTPAPLSQKSIFSLYVVPHLLGHSPEGVQFCREARDEVQDRVKQGIAALATERCRLMDDSEPPWHFLKLYRYLETYGALCIGSQYSFSLGGNLVKDSQGNWIPPLTPDQRGMPMKTREDALRAMATFYVEKPILANFTTAEDKSSQVLEMAQQWHADGIILHLNRGCEGLSQGALENRMALLESGLPVMTYEGNMGDKREFDEGQTLNRIDSFMERLGLSKLED
ncbi:MAG: 2-hydroxyacyl-CoA dehydratase family protein, partial [Dehalococcoidia bacterium]|nr:2-hydroxyacyl-CoA dehydratase family protein [Dehalococcoidia bacterium]